MCNVLRGRRDRHTRRHREAVVRFEDPLTGLARRGQTGCFYTGSNLGLGAFVNGYIGSFEPQRVVGTTGKWSPQKSASINRRGVLLVAARCRQDAAEHGQGAIRRGVRVPYRLFQLGIERGAPPAVEVRIAGTGG